MNGTESRFFQEVVLPGMKEGTFLGWWFEEWTFKLGPNLRFTPDFVLLLSDGRLEVHEVKARDRKTGRWRAEDDARVKVKVMADWSPLTVRVAFPAGKIGEGWQWDTLTPDREDTT